MSGPRRTKGETLPASAEELDRLKQQTTEMKPPVPRAPGASAPNRNVVPARRGNSAHSLVPAPPLADDGDSEEVVIEMSGDDEDDDPAPRRSRSDTLSDPMTTAKLAEAARAAPAPAPPTPDGPNRHVKRRGG